MRIKIFMAPQLNPAQRTQSPSSKSLSPRLDLDRDVEDPKFRSRTYKLNVQQRNFTNLGIYGYISALTRK